ncbi:class I SAM-dependent methyltransferase [Chloroflexi bacterium TSY]|nr:class I SAM-dependent methyltransferase [Chloroflexi bacterium TSY]
MNSRSILAYNSDQQAQNYNSRRGFDPARKERMLNSALRLLIDLAPTDSTLLELGAGTGLFTQKIVDSTHFSRIHVTDGASSMLSIAQEQLTSCHTQLTFELLDFAGSGWSARCHNVHFDAVTSSMAIHHVADKQRLFDEVFHLLSDGGIFVIADHISGSSELFDKVIQHERGRTKLAANGLEQPDSAAMISFIASDLRKQAAEGNRCESLTQYLHYLSSAGFQHVDCLWRDSWLAVIVAIKKGTIS